MMKKNMKRMMIKNMKRMMIKNMKRINMFKRSYNRKGPPSLNDKLWLNPNKFRLIIKIYRISQILLIMLRFNFIMGYSHKSGEYILTNCDGGMGT